MGNPEKRPACRVLPVTPSWVTPELIDSTIKVWQPHYAEPLTKDDALEMILNVSELFAVLRERTDDRSDGIK